MPTNMLPALHHHHHPTSSSNSSSGSHHHPSEVDMRHMPPSASTSHNNHSPRRHTYTTCPTTSNSNTSGGRSRSQSCHSYSQQQPYEAMMVSPPPPICTLPEASPLLDELFARDATMLNLTPDTVEAIMMSLQIEREEMQLRQETEERATRSLLDTMLLEEASQQQQPQPQQPQRRRRQVQFQVQDSESSSSSEVIEEEDEEEPLEEEQEHMRNLAFAGNGASFAAPRFRNDDFLFGGAEDLGRMIMPLPCDSNHSVTSNSGASQEGSTSQDKTPPKYSYNNYEEKVVLSYKSSSSSVSTNGGDHHSCSSNDNGSIKSSEKKLQGGDLKSPPPETSAAAAAAASNSAANRTINKRDCQCLICHRFAADHRELRFKMLTPCGHVFCKTCVQDFLVKKKKCPYCRHPVTQRGKQQEANSNSTTTAPMAA